VAKGLPEIRALGTTPPPCRGSDSDDGATRTLNSIREQRILQDCARDDRDVPLQKNRLMRTTEICRRWQKHQSIWNPFPRMKARDRQ